VESVDEEVRALLDDMAETMYHAPGIGLAATQLGIMKRLVVCDIAVDEEDEPQLIKLVNPEISQLSEDKMLSYEGCLSLPDVFDDVERSVSCTVNYLDETGTQQTLQAEGLLAFVMQHEVDHLNGVLFIDYLSKLKRDTILRRMKKVKRQDEEVA
jgi:peptide deformylase